MPGFRSGMARLLDFGNTFDTYNHAANGGEADGLGLMLDWEMVRNDLWQAVSDYNSETELTQTECSPELELASR